MSQPLVDGSDDSRAAGQGDRVHRDRPATGRLERPDDVPGEGTREAVADARVEHARRVDRVERRAGGAC